MQDLLPLFAQYGALGLIAAVLIWESREMRKGLAGQNTAHQDQMARRLASLENILIELVRNNTAALENSSRALAELTRLLGKRTCLLDQDEIWKRAAEHVRDIAP